MAFELFFPVFGEGIYNLVPSFKSIRLFKKNSFLNEIYMIIVAEQVRLRQWAAQIQECQSRPSDMKGEIWCNEHGITKANLNILVR